jgi:putative oxidoreductase
MTLALTSRIRHADGELRVLLARHSITLLRVALGFVFLAFGALKFFPGLSPAEELARQTVDLLTFGLVPAQIGILVVATVEVAIGVILITGRWLRVGLVLLGMALIGILSPIVLLRDELFRGSFFAPTLEGQYVIKDVVLAAAAAVIAAQALGARLTMDRGETARVEVDR